MAEAKLEESKKQAGNGSCKKPVKVAGWIRSLSSQSASLISVTVCFPLEVVKTRMQI